VTKGGAQPVPQHVAIIMDGNGRWAEERGLARTAGHKQGIEALRSAVRSAAHLGVKYLTVYSFSTENWSRPKSEVVFLLDLLRRFIRQDVSELHASGVKIVIIGEREGIEKPLLKMLQDAEQLTRNNDKLTLFVAFNYGSRQEIVRVARHLAEALRDGHIAADNITVDDFTRNLDTGGAPDPDLLIRTGGEQRISNFLLWQCAYAEFVFAPEHWPDFNHEIFARCISEYHQRDRRFGGLKVKTA
jgi:undecaprenyl diphosphate synthase